uniref:Secreted protein n=1 Tax=Ditylenchus dipsaci TaxID=166011 RepID=A0A915D6T4_9BILA
MVGTLIHCCCCCIVLQFDGQCSRRRSEVSLLGKVIKPSILPSMNNTNLFYLTTTIVGKLMCGATANNNIHSMSGSIIL